MNQKHEASWLLKNINYINYVHSFLSNYPFHLIIELRIILTQSEL